MKWTFSNFTCTTRTLQGLLSGLTLIGKSPINFGKYIVIWPKQGAQVDEMSFNESPVNYRNRGVNGRGDGEDLDND